MKLHGPVFMIVFDDTDVSPQVFAGEQAKECAKRAFEMHLMNWNCCLFQRIDDGVRGSARREAFRRALAIVAETSDETDHMIMTWAQRHPRVCASNHPTGEPLLFGGRAIPSACPGRE